MKNPACPCVKKKKRKTTQPSKKVSVPAAVYNKFAGVRAPIPANTSGVFDRPLITSSRGGSLSIPGFAPVNSFPYPGISIGNTSQMYGLLTGRNLADLAAANIYRVQDRKDDVASGIGVTGLNSAPKGNVISRNVNMRRFGPLIRSVKKEGQPSEAEILKAQRLGLESARFNAYNPGVGDSQDNPISIGGSSLPPSSSPAIQENQSRTNPPRQAAAVGTQRRAGVM
jgi:hypothetical protein